jgi:hypothetical protein
MTVNGGAQPRDEGMVMCTGIRFALTPRPAALSAAARPCSPPGAPVPFRTAARVRVDEEQRRGVRQEFGGEGAAGLAVAGQRRDLNRGRGRGADADMARAWSVGRRVTLMVPARVLLVSVAEWGGVGWRGGRWQADRQAGRLVEGVHSPFPYDTRTASASTQPSTKPSQRNVSISRSLTHSLSHSVTQSLTHSVTHSLTHSLSHSLTHSRCLS